MTKCSSSGRKTHFASEYVVIISRAHVLLYLSHALGPGLLVHRRHGDPFQRHGHPIVLSLRPNLSEGTGEQEPARTSHRKYCTTNCVQSFGRLRLPAAFPFCLLCYLLRTTLTCKYLLQSFYLVYHLTDRLSQTFPCRSPV